MVKKPRTPVRLGMRRLASFPGRVGVEPAGARVRRVRCEASRSRPLRASPRPIAATGRYRRIRRIHRRHAPARRPHPGRHRIGVYPAQDAVDRLIGSGRDRALLQARRLLVGCLAADRRPNQSQALLATLAAQCAEHGMSRYLVDAGPPITATVEALVERHRQNRWPAQWPAVPQDFLAALQTTRVK